MPSHAELAAKLLEDAAGFFRTLGEQNAPLRAQMEENANVFLQMGTLLRQDPTGSIAGPPVSAPEVPAPSAAPAFQDRTDWVEALSSGPGDRPFLGPGLDPWARCDAEDASALRTAVAGDLSETDRAQLETADIWHMAPPFYASATLYHAVLPGPRGADAFFLDHPVLTEPAAARIHTAVRFTSPAIQAANAQAPLLFDGAEYPYFLFFMHLVRGERGAFRLVTEATITGLADLLRDAGRPEVAGRLRLPQFLHFDAQGGVRYGAQVLYGGAVFAASFRIQPTGLVEMLDDTPLCETIPALVEIPEEKGEG